MWGANFLLLSLLTHVGVTKFVSATRLIEVLTKAKEMALYKINSFVLHADVI